MQLNDTHLAMAVAESMRILPDKAHLGWDDAWELTQKTLGYTNHTLLSEALEKGPLAWFEIMLPRQLEIILEINRCFLDSVRSHFLGDEGRVQRVSLVEEGAQRKIRMTNLAIVGSHSTNGVAALHSRLMCTTTVKDLAAIYRERFGNKTNGVTPRRWLRPQWHYDNEPETRAALDLTFSNHFSPYEPGIFGPIRDTLLNRGDYYMHLADPNPTWRLKGRSPRFTRIRTAGPAKRIINVACSGRFSSDRTIREYAAEVWHARSCPVGQEGGNPQKMDWAIGEYKLGGLHSPEWFGVIRS